MKSIIRQATPIAAQIRSFCRFFLFREVFELFRKVFELELKWNIN